MTFTEASNVLELGRTWSKGRKKEKGCNGSEDEVNAEVALLPRHGECGGVNSKFSDTTIEEVVVIFVEKARSAVGVSINVLKLDGGVVGVLANRLNCSSASLSRCGRRACSSNGAGK